MWSELQRHQYHLPTTYIDIITVEILHDLSSKSSDLYTCISMLYKSVTAILAIYSMFVFPQTAGFKICLWMFVIGFNVWQRNNLEKDSNLKQAAVTCHDDSSVRQKNSQETHTLIVIMELNVSRPGTTRLFRLPSLLKILQPME